MDNKAVFEVLTEKMKQVEKRNKSEEQDTEKHEEEEYWKRYYKDLDRRDLDDLNSVYKLLRYFIPFDGSVKNYCFNYDNPYIRTKRIMFVEFQTDRKKKKIIDTVVSKREN